MDMVMLVDTYNSVRDAIEGIADKCNTLSMAKAQMKAFEIQQEKNTRPVPMNYQIADIPEATLKALCDLKDNYSCFFHEWDDETLIAECRNLWENCKKQPISLVLLPALLTILMVEGVGHKSVYAYLKLGLV